MIERVILAACGVLACMGLGFMGAYFVLVGVTDAEGWKSVVLTIGGAATIVCALVFSLHLNSDR